MSVHPYGEHLVLSSSTTVRVWDPEGDELVTRFDDFEEAVDALPLGDDIVVSEYDTGSVVASGLTEPAGLAAHGGDLYVADRSGSVLQVLEDGEPLDPARTVATGLAGPEGIATDDNGRLYVVEEDAGRVVQIDPASGTTAVVAEGLALQSLEQKSIGESTAVGFLSGIAVGNGSLYVTSYAENLVYRIDR